MHECTAAKILATPCSKCSLHNAVKNAVKHYPFIIKKKYLNQLVLRYL